MYCYPAYFHHVSAVHVAYVVAYVPLLFQSTQERLKHVAWARVHPKKGQLDSKCPELWWNLSKMYPEYRVFLSVPLVSLVSHVVDVVEDVLAQVSDHHDEVYPNDHLLVELWVHVVVSALAVYLVVVDVAALVVMIDDFDVVVLLVDVVRVTVDAVADSAAAAKPYHLGAK